MVLDERGRKRPLVRIFSDYSHGTIDPISPDGRFVAWGTDDGTISVVDLWEINRRLTGARLGW